MGFTIRVRNSEETVIRFIGDKPLRYIRERVKSVCLLGFLLVHSATDFEENVERQLLEVLIQALFDLCDRHWNARPCFVLKREDVGLVADFFGVIRRRARLLGNEQYPRTGLALAARFLYPNKHVLSRSDRIAPTRRKCDIHCSRTAVLFEISACTCS